MPWYRNPTNAIAALAVAVLLLVAACTAVTPLVEQTQASEQSATTTATASGQPEIRDDGGWGEQIAQALDDPSIFDPSGPDWGNIDSPDPATIAPLNPQTEQPARVGNIEAPQSGSGTGHQPGPLTVDEINAMVTGSFGPTTNLAGTVGVFVGFPVELTGPADTEIVGIGFDVKQVAEQFVTVSIRPSHTTTATVAVTRDFYADQLKMLGATFEPPTTSANMKSAFIAVDSFPNAETDLRLRITISERPSGSYVEMSLNYSTEQAPNDVLDRFANWHQNDAPMLGGAVVSGFSMQTDSVLGFANYTTHYHLANMPTTNAVADFQTQLAQTSWAYEQPGPNTFTLTGPYAVVADFSGDETETDFAFTTKHDLTP